MSLAMLVIGGLTVVPVAQAKVSMSSIRQSAQQLLDKTQATAGSTYDNIKSSLKKSSSKTKELWNGLSPDTKTAILAGLVTAGAVAAAGTAYAVSSSDGGVPESVSFNEIWEKISPSDQKSILTGIIKMPTF